MEIWQWIPVSREEDAHPKMLLNVIDLGLNIHSPNIYHNSYADYISDHGGQFVVITSSFQA